MRSSPAQFVFASVHLLTMFLTRWGDRRVTGKALLFSLILHFGLFMAVVTIPVPPGIPGGGPEDPKGHDDEHRVVIHSSIDSAEREARENKAAGTNTPVWEQAAAHESRQDAGPKTQRAGRRHAERRSPRRSSTGARPQDAGPGQSA